jgi:uncharacterized phage infection (PIP) family protein YhgE
MTRKHIFILGLLAVVLLAVGLFVEFKNRSDSAARMELRQDAFALHYTYRNLPESMQIISDQSKALSHKVDDQISNHRLSMESIANELLDLEERVAVQPDQATFIFRGKQYDKAQFEKMKSWAVMSIGGKLLLIDQLSGLRREFQKASFELADASRRLESEVKRLHDLKQKGLDIESISEFRNQLVEVTDRIKELQLNDVRERLIEKEAELIGPENMERFVTVSAEDEKKAVALLDRMRSTRKMKKPMAIKE